MMNFNQKCSTIRISGFGGEILLSRIEDFDETKKVFQKKTPSELLQFILNDSKISIDGKICHQSGLFFKETLKLNWNDSNNNEHFLTYDDLYENPDYYNENCLLGNLEKGYYLLYIASGKMSSLDLEVELKELNSDLIELITFRISEIDEAKLDAEEEYLICNKIKILDDKNKKNNKILDLELDDSGLESKLFIFHTDGNYGYQIFYQNEEWI